MSTLEQAIVIALDVHTKHRRDNEPRMLHSLRMMQRLQQPHEKIVAVLHEVPEQSWWTLQALQERGFAPEVIEALRVLARDQEEPYDAYICRVAHNPIARSVKVADLEDNLNSPVWKSTHVSHKTPQFLAALAQLKQ